MKFGPMNGLAEPILVPWAGQAAADHSTQVPASGKSKTVYNFDRFELDIARFELRERGAVQPLEPQVFAVLAYLIEHRERLVSRSELFEKLWSGRVVTDSVLTSRIKSARKAIGDNGKAQQFIKTIHGRGFRFIADVRFANVLSHELLSNWSIRLTTVPRKKGLGA